MPSGVADLDPEGGTRRPSMASLNERRMSAAAIGSSHVRGKEHDEARLNDLGYKQELKREWSLLHNFGVSFSIISVITGITTLFEYGLTTGGPGVMSVGWIVVCFFTMFVALGMAEIVSAIPSAGGPYFWAAILAPKKHAPFASWCTGWFNLLGQVAVTTGITFGCAGLISTLASVRGYDQSAGKTLGIYAALLTSHGIVNSFGVKFLRYLNNSSVILHSLGVFSLAVAVLAAAPKHRTAKEVFAFFYDGTGVDGVGWSERASPAYVACIGILIAQYTITGFDASAHMSEETQNAAWSAPIGVMMSVGCSGVFGFFLIVSLLFSIQDFDTTVASKYGQPVLQILLDIFGETGATVLFVLIILCVWHCGLFSLTSNSRMMFSFARDGGIPDFFHKVSASSCVSILYLANLFLLLRSTTDSTLPSAPSGSQHCWPSSSPSHQLAAPSPSQLRPRLPQSACISRMACPS
jgi:amino acid transporter